MLSRHVDLSRVVFVLVTVAGIVGLSFGVGLYSGVTRNRLFVLTAAVKDSIEGSFASVAEEASTLAGTRPSHFLQPRRYDGDGVTLNTRPDDGALILLSGFFDRSNELRLLRRDGTVLARWPVQFSSIFPNRSHLPEASRPATDWNIDTHGALALPDGSVVFNFEWGGLVELDRCGEVLWTLPRQTHHSVERAEGGGFWVPGRRVVTEGPSPFPPFEVPFREDTILRVSEDGRVLAEHSVPKIFYDNGLDALLTAAAGRRTRSEWDPEIVHLNKVEELTNDIAGDFPTFRAGDLALSIRDMNLIMVVDDGAATVKWWQVGPWLRQHDPEFRRGGTITLFNNNVYAKLFGPEGWVSPVSAPRVSNIADINPATGQYRVLYGGTEGHELMSIIRGKVDVTPGDGLLITEFEGGRALETDANGHTVWEYVNRFSPDEVSEITEARVYPAGYFEVSDWSCESAGRSGSGR